MGQYLIDTNVISYYFSGSLPERGMQFIDSVVDTVPHLSVISQIELLCWKTDSDNEQKIKGFIGDSVILDITQDIILYCVSIRRNKKIKTPDAIIAATALSHGYTLITNNEKDFSNIRSLKIVNPFTI